MVVPHLPDPLPAPPAYDGPYDTGGNIRMTGLVDFTHRMVRASPPPDASLSSRLGALRLGLCGRVDNGPNTHANERYEQIRISPERDRPFAPLAGHEFVMEARVHSFFLISKNIDIADTLLVHPFPNPELRLLNPAAPWYTHGDRSVSAATIPSFCLGSWHGGLGKIWVGLPKLLDVQVNGGHPLLDIPQDLYPAIRALVQSALGQAHNADMANVRGVMQRGLRPEDMFHLELPVPRTELVAFSTQLRVEARKTRVRALRELVLITEVGPLDSTFIYTIGALEEQRGVFSQLAKLFKPGCLDLAGSNPYVRLQARICVPGLTLRVNAEKHIEWLRWLIPTLTQGEAEDITGHRSFSLDPPANVQALAGFVWSPDPERDGRYSQVCQHVEILHSDCQLISDLGLPVVKLGSMLPHRIRELRGALAHLCTRMGAMLDDGDLMDDGSLHIDTRLPLRAAQVAMSRLTPQDASAWVIPYTTHSWGEFIYRRALVLQSAVNLVAAGQYDARGTNEALLLSVALAIMLNGLAGRHRGWPFARRLLMASGRREILNNPVANRQFRQLSRYIGDSHGMYFLCDIRMDNSAAHRALRLPRAAVLTFGSNIRRLFGIDEEAVLNTMTPPADAPIDPIEWAPQDM